MAAILFGLEKALEDMLHRIADKYELDYNELHQFAMVPSDSDESSVFEEPPPGGVKPKAKPKAKAATDERAQCQGLTTKKTQCKKFALAGGDFCACHQKKADTGDEPKAKGKPKSKPNKGKAKVVDDAESDNEVISPPMNKGKGGKGITRGTPVTSPVKGMRSPPPAPKKKVEKHSHPIDEEDHDECEMCAEQGNAGKFSSPRYKVGPSAASRLRNILAQVDMEGSGSDTEGEDETQE